MTIGKRKFEYPGHCYVCGILNVTPDSFSDGGNYSDVDRAVMHALEMERDGAALIDIGGESTRPGYTPVSAEDEMERVIPVIRKIREHSDIPISVDTYKPSVAKEVISAGADMINDISFLADPGMTEVLKETDCVYCLMHNDSAPDAGRAFNDRDGEKYRINRDKGGTIGDITDSAEADITKHIINGLSAKAELLLDAGIKHERIILDPGVGFAKDAAQNLKTVADVKRFGEMGYPVLLGASRKSVIGDVLGLPVKERLEGTLAITAHAVVSNISFVRVHDVKENVRFIKMLEAVRGAM
ncbi:MAG: dihydropteroate synthase [Lachnospiraceae bacterium]|nr:dihydropteroate synthase [Lachnospiraceae bacterium]